MKKYFLYLLLITGIFTPGCKKYLDVNKNPNLVTDAPINGLLANTTYQTGLNVQRMGNITSYYVQYLASSNVGGDRDTYKEEDLSGTWSSHYNVMMDINKMMELAQTNNATEHLGVAKVLMAMNLNMLIMMFGDVPYSEAFQGQQLLTPKYDNQEQLHATSIQLLDEAITEFNKTTSALKLDKNSDVIHGGNITSWKKTANALKARFLNQLSEKSEKYKPADILAALANAYTSNSDDAQITVFQARSPWNQVAFNNTQLLLDGWLSEQFVDALDSTSGKMDPRLALITNRTKFFDFRGTANGKGRIGTGTSNEESVLTITGFYSKPGAPLLLVTFAEMKFIESEAAFRSGDKTRAYAAYLAGIRAHMDKLGVSASDRDAYINHPTTSVGANNLTLDVIFREKYIVMFLHPEAWVDARRFDYAYKDFTLPVGAALPTFIRRSAYPVVETSRNRENVPVVTLSTRLWWDQ